MEIQSHYPRPEILLQPNIIKPLHGLNPRSLLGKEGEKYYSKFENFSDWLDFYSS